mgnify:CR=1 FL=1
MLRSKQYKKLYKKYNNINIVQSYSLFYVWQRAYSKVCVIKSIPELKAYFKRRRLYEKGM